MRSSRIRRALNPTMSVLIRDDTKQDEGEGHGKMEAETEVTVAPAEDRLELQQPPEARREAWTDSPQSLHKEPTLPIL